MVYLQEKCKQLCGFFVFKWLLMEVVCNVLKLVKFMGICWKVEVCVEGDDWDSVWVVVVMGDDNFIQFLCQFLEDYLVQYKVLIELLCDNMELGVLECVNILVSMVDSFGKIMVSFKCLVLEINKYVIVLDILQCLVVFVQYCYLKYVGVLLEMLEFFGEDLVKVYG